MTERRPRYAEPEPVTFSVPGQPVPKQSFRYTGANGRGGGYTDPRVKAWQTLVSQHARLAMAGREPFTCPVSVTLTFFLPTRRRVDADNLSKAVLDSLNGIVFVDDNQVMKLVIQKLYGTPGGVGVIVEGAA